MCAWSGLGDVCVRECVCVREWCACSVCIQAFLVARFFFLFVAKFLQCTFQAFCSTAKGLQFRLKPTRAATTTAAATTPTTAAAATTTAIRIKLSSCTSERERFYTLRISVHCVQQHAPEFTIFCKTGRMQIFWNIFN